MMTARRTELILKPGGLSWLPSLIAGGFLGWCAVLGAQGLWQGFQAGRLLNRRGPDILMDDRPLVFFALSGFYGMGILLACGMAIVCILIALRDVLGKKTS